MQKTPFLISEYSLKKAQGNISFIYNEPERKKTRKMAEVQKKLNPEL